MLRANANPKIPRPAVAIRIDATAPASSEWPLFATALASTTSNEDITANNETDAILSVNAMTARGIAKAGGKTKAKPSTERSRSAAISGVPRAR